MSSPTKRSLDYLRKLGWQAEVTEKWNPHARIRQDLFGFVDILAVMGEQTLAVQTTSSSNMAARVKKIADLDSVSAVRKAGWLIHVHGWRKNSKGRWVLRTEDIS